MDVHIRLNCTGPNINCRSAAKEGKTVHIIPAPGDVVLNTYHYATEDEAREALARAQATAPTIRNDDDLFRCRSNGLSYRLPIGWTDPSMRRPADRGYPRCLCGHVLCFLDRQRDTCPDCNAKIHPYLRLDNDFRPTDPTVPVGFIPMNNGLILFEN